MEDRTTPTVQLIATFPSADPSGTLLDGLYQNLLNRTIDTSGLQAWTAVLALGASEQIVAGDFWTSAEHRGLEVDQFYHTLLQRPADAGGRQLWAAALSAGANEESIMAAIASSPEFMQSGASNGGFEIPTFVDNLYARVLGRTADSNGRSFWIAALEGQLATPVQVATAFIQSNEAGLAVIDGYYANLLGRSPAAAEEQAWLGALHHGTLDYQSTGIAFLSSNEYSARWPNVGFVGGAAGVRTLQKYAPPVITAGGQLNQPLGQAKADAIAQALGFDKQNAFTQAQYLTFISGQGANGSGNVADAQLVDESVAIFTNSTANPLIRNINGVATPTVLGSYGVFVDSQGMLESPANELAPTRLVNSVIAPGGYLSTWAAANGADASVARPVRINRPLACPLSHRLCTATPRRIVCLRRG